MKITQKYLQEKYEYDPETDYLIYKYDCNKGRDWNDRFVGEYVKPTLSAGKRYIFVCDALYSYSQIISILEGEKRNLTKKTPYDLACEKRKLEKEFLKLPFEEQHKLGQGLVLDALSMSDVGKKVNAIARLTHIKQAQPKSRKGLIGSRNMRAVKKAKDYFNPDDIETNDATGLPSNIYLNAANMKYYVRVKYKGQSHRRYGYDTLNEAFAIRNEIYRQMIEAEENGVDMSSFEVNVARKESDKPPINETKFGKHIINPKTNLPQHIYHRRDNGSYRVKITHKGITYMHDYKEYEEALQKRNELYEVLLNGKEANESGD